MTALDNVEPRDHTKAKKSVLMVEGHIKESELTSKARDTILSEIAELKRKLKELEGGKRGTLSEAIKCYNCNKHGHISRNCKAKRRVPKKKTSNKSSEDIESGKGSQD